MGRKKTSHMEWAYKHATPLKEKKDELRRMNVHSNINDYLKDESYEYGVGHWTILKHISLAYCLNPFGIILNSKRIRDTVYLDLFCGAGITPLKSSESSEIEWIVGSPIISTRMTDYPFKAYYFGDKSRSAVALAKDILDEWNKISGEKRKYEIFLTDANAMIKQLIPRIKNKYVFAFIDPTGFQWNWESMESLFRCRMFDIIMNFQTRQVNRISKEKEKVEAFFGPCADMMRTLRNCDEKLDAYINQIREEGLTVTPIRIGMNRTNQYYYHLLHISRLDTYKSIILSAKNRVERFNGTSIKMIWDDLHGLSRQTSLPVE